jgi:hypothetical protein
MKEKRKGKEKRKVAKRKEKINEKPFHVFYELLF